MSKIVYWLWLQKVIGYNKKIKNIIKYFGSPEALFKAGEAAWIDYGFAVKQVKRMKETTLESFKETIDFCKKHSLYILTPEDEFYPEGLLELEDYPAVLFARGDYTCLKNERSVSVIGSREPCVYGEKAVKRIVSHLSDNDFLIVSGGALGIDSLAHKNAIESGGKTVLVLGYGHGAVYLPENSALRKQIANNGVIISEYLPFTKPNAGSFSRRNELISAMTKAVVIIEAAAASRTFSTARYARSLGRKVFVLPGDITSGRFEGSNQLVREGATAIFSGDDITSILLDREAFVTQSTIESDISFLSLDEIASSSKKRRKKSFKKTKKETTSAQQREKINIFQKNMPEGISKNAEIVYNIMLSGVSYLDEITRDSNLQIRQVLVALTELEMLGAVSAIGPNQYQLK